MVCLQSINVTTNWRKTLPIRCYAKAERKKEWNASSIRRILTSEIYIGKYTYNKRKTQKIKGEKPKLVILKTYTIREKED